MELVSSFVEQSGLIFQVVRIVVLNLRNSAIDLLREGCFDVLILFRLSFSVGEFAIIWKPL